jgi:iron complex outermembrane receptor protein
MAGFKMSRAILALPLAMLMVAVVLPVEAADPVTSGELEEIQVTGTRLKTVTGFEAPTPVTVFSGGEIALEGPRNLADALVQLPALIASSSGRTGQAASGIAEAGDFLNLRNFGPQRTLVLVDGQRITPAATTGAGDINLIPQALVSRVDLVTGGASAAYGSDAVAGVVNIVLDTKFTGLKGDIQGGISDYGDAASNKEELTGGMGFADDRGHVVFSVSHQYQAPLYSFADRPWGNLGTGLVTVKGVPSNIMYNDVSQVSAYGGVIISPGPLQNTQFLQGGVPAAFTPGTVFNTLNQVGGTQDRNYSNLSSLVEVDDVFLRAQYEVSDNFTAHIEGGFSLSHDEYDQVYDYNYATSPLTIYSGNPFIPQSIQAVMTAKNIPSFTMNRTNADFGPAFGDFNDRGLNFNAGVSGKIFDGWSIDAYYQYGQTVENVQTLNNENFQNEFAAVDVVVNPANGQDVCRVTLTNPGLYPGCVPLNLFGAGSPSKEALNYVVGTSYYQALLKQNVVEATIRGNVFSLPAGPVSVAVGADYRSESVAQISDPISQEVKTAVGIQGFPAALKNVIGGYLLTNTQPISGSYDIKEVYGESLLPLLKDVVFARSLDLNMAVRYTNYSNSGGVDTWKFGITYKPVKDILLRGTVSEDIRGPNLSELFSANIQGQGGILDDFQHGKPTQVYTASYGNPNLLPEKARTYTGGLVVRPSWFNGFDASVDYWKINLSDAIQALTSQQTIDQCYAGLQTACANISRLPDGDIGRIVTPYLNFASIKTSGIDFEVGYRSPVSAIHEGWHGDLDVRGFLTHLNYYTSQVPGGTPIQTGGEIGVGNLPTSSGSVKFTYTNNPITLFVQERYIGQGIYNTALVQGVTINNNHIPSIFYTDLTGQYALNLAGADFTLFLTINNLMNRNPPVFPTLATVVWDSTNFSLYDVLGRYYTAGLRFRFK